MRRLGIAALALGVVVLLGLAALLGMAHQQIDALDPPLPSFADLLGFAAGTDRPERIAWLDTARQRMPRALVLDPARDPHPDAAYAMSHPVFVLSWRDGRLLLVDAGMDPETARGFGRSLEWFGAEPIEPRGAAGERLRAALARAPRDGVGIVFTHLHIDHVAGIDALCRALPAGGRLRVFQREAQARLGNYTTRPGRTRLAAAPCVDPVRLDEAPAAAVPGFGGVFVLDAAGHTPGSQIVGAWLAGDEPPHGWLLAGDVANAREGIDADAPKPWAYRTFLVPECERRQGRLRRFLRESVERAGLSVAVSHDALALEASGLPGWSAAAE